MPSPQSWLRSVSYCCPPNKHLTVFANRITKINLLIVFMLGECVCVCVCVCVCMTISAGLVLHVRDFVNGLDNLHEYLRFSYPKVQPPTFFCQEESATGVTLHYRSDQRRLSA